LKSIPVAKGMKLLAAPVKFGERINSSGGW
jgi:hypothetical protein